MLGVRNILKRVAAGEATAESETRACLDRIAERETAVGAWAFLDPARAVAEARRRDQSRAKGPLHGVAVGIKDIFDTADMPTSYGSPIYADHKPAADAACVALLRAAGAVALGKTVTTEFAMTHPGQTRNPHNPAHTPGGSSSGSAAAVAAGMVPVALGTQTLGSVIRPAAFCGIVGFKPSYGAINRAGTKLISESADTIGLFTRSVADIPPVLAAFTGAPMESYDKTLDKAPRIGLVRGVEWDKAAAPAQAAFEDAARRLAKAGASVCDVAVDPALTTAHERSRIITGYELARAYAYEWFNHRDRLSPAFARNVADGMAIAFADYNSARGAFDVARRVAAEAFGDCDFWLTLPAPGEAPKGIESTGDPVFNRLWTLLHVPCLTVPCGKGPAGLPLGVQLIGPPRSAARLLAAGRWVEAALA
ncbi:MAG: amidase [Alphaproteobacteria bacterium]|nr:amidase [Alphaproteobacteria bacterium]